MDGSMVRPPRTDSDLLRLARALGRYQANLERASETTEVAGDEGARDDARTPDGGNANDRYEDDGKPSRSEARVLKMACPAFAPAPRVTL